LAHKAQPAPKRKRRFGGLIGAVLIVALVGAGGLQISGLGRAGIETTLMNSFTIKPMDFQVSLKESGELQALNSVDVKCEVEGSSTILWIVEEGKMVAKGDLLVELASDQIDEKVQTAEISVATKEAAAGAAKSEYEIQKDQNDSDIKAAALTLELAELSLEQYLKGNWIQQETEALLLVKEAVSGHMRAQERSEASARLYEKKFLTKVELDDDLFAFEKAKYILKKAELAYEILKEYTHTMDLKRLEEDVVEAKRELARVNLQANASLAKAEVNRDAAIAELDLTRQRLEKYREEKNKTKIFAPAPGLVVYHNERYSRDDGIKEGATIRERQTMIRLPDTNIMTAEVRIHETKTNQISPGQQVIVTVEGLPDQRFTGKVTKIGALADSRDRWLNRELKEYQTQITLDQAIEAMRPGSTVKVEILVDALDDVLAVPVQAVFSKGGRNYVFLKKAAKMGKPIEVSLGQASEEYVEIVKGVALGQEVMLAISDEMKREIPEPDPNKLSGTDDVAESDRPAPSKGPSPSPTVVSGDHSEPKGPSDRQRTDREPGKGPRSQAVQ
jgi:HlyD family secretion protein